MIIGDLACRGPVFIKTGRLSITMSRLLERLSRSSDLYIFKTSSFQQMMSVISVTSKVEQKVVLNLSQTIKKN